MDGKDLLLNLLKSPTINAVSMWPNKNRTQFRKGTWTLLCSRGIVMNEMDESHFHPDSVGKNYVPIQTLKRTKLRGQAVKGKLFLFCI
jgi:hypothetical protein